MNINAKERKKKERQVKRVKKKKGIAAQTPSQETDAHTVNEEYNWRQKKEKDVAFPTQLLWTIWLPLMTLIDHTEGIYIYIKYILFIIIY